MWYWIALGWNGSSCMYFDENVNKINKYNGNKLKFAHISK